MSSADLLIELGTEELPPKALLNLAKAFRDGVVAGLANAHLAGEAVEYFASPRRLAVKLKNVPLQQPASIIEKLGPALNAAFDENGNPTRAAEGFARSCGVAVSDLAQKQDGQVTKLYYQASREGEPAEKLIPATVNEAIAKLPIPKRMRWGSSRVEFVRPVHWVVLLHGDRVIEAEILGIKSSNTTRGHRFHHPGEITLDSPGDYGKKLIEPGCVIASFTDRLEKIRTLVEAEGRKANAVPMIDDALLSEVTALVEWPVALTGSFDETFLQVPKEALISSMKEHQKCFPLLDDNGDMKPFFITVSNIESIDPGQVIAGNEKVIRPRLADAAFFFEQDKKQPLISRRDKLQTVIFQQDLGTLHDKSERVARLATTIAGLLNADPDKCVRAAQLAKCDLLTGMVNEFADLQGIMGYYYAVHDGEDNDVALAINEQYLPRFSGDALPQSSTGVVLALAERIDTIVGLFGIGQPPTGSKDPFALRRAALGILRILVEKALDLDLEQCVNKAVSGYSGLPVTQALETSVLDFIFDRFRAWYADLGVETHVFQAVEAVRPANPLEFDLRIKAVNEFAAMAEAESLAMANKRVSNILAKLDRAPASTIDPSLLTEEAEAKLAASLKQLMEDVEPLLSARRYSAALKAMAALHRDVDNFFDQVMVNTEDEKVRQNRQALLQQLRQLFLQIADISLLQTG